MPFKVQIAPSIAAAGGSLGILDVVTSVKYALSLRELKAGATVARIERSVDNAELDFGDLNGNKATIEAWLAEQASEGELVRFYNQGSQGGNYNRNTTGAALTSGGTLLTGMNGKAVCDPNGSSDRINWPAAVGFPSTTGFDFFCVVENTSNDNLRPVCGSNTLDDRLNIQNDEVYWRDASLDDRAFMVDSTQGFSQYHVYCNGDSILRVSRDGAADIIVNPMTAPNPVLDNLWFRGGGSTHWNGYKFHEVIFNNLPLTTAERDAINADQRTFYGV